MVISKNYFKTTDSSAKKAWISLPDQCPMCHVAIEPIYLYDKYSEETDTFNAFLFCNYCKRPFISAYTNPSYSSDNPSVATLFPKFHIPMKFEKCINDLSSSFCDIYNQALQAESENLTQISGIGYRKALEFLIKDFCIYKFPDKEEKIKSSFLSTVINDYIDSLKIQNLAKACAWLGNDETHYVRKYEDKDINDLKRFIKATVAFITYELTSDEAEEFVNS